MAKSEKRKQDQDRKDAIVHRALAFERGPAEETSFTRADLVFEGVDHAQGSYEVRVFLNNPKADETTARSAETGYAGRFVVFGHGRCFGAEGHCDSKIAAPPRSGTLDPAGGRQHPLTPQTRILTITEPLRRVLDASGKRLESLTLVPIAKTPRRADSGLAAGLFKCSRVSLRTYR
jgi:tyrosinase